MTEDSGSVRPGSAPTAPSYSAKTKEQSKIIAACIGAVVTSLTSKYTPLPWAQLYARGAGHCLGGAVERRGGSEVNRPSDRAPPSAKHP